jgi:outer membrane biosynthesis protein TonB
MRHSIFVLAIAALGFIAVAQQPQQSATPSPTPVAPQPEQPATPTPTPPPQQPEQSATPSPTPVAPQPEQSATPTPTPVAQPEEPAAQPTPTPQRVSPQEIERLKAEIAKASNGHRAQLNGELANKLVDMADQQFVAGQSVKAHAIIQESFEHATAAHDEALHTRKKMKEVEIHLRETQRHMEVVRRTLAAEDRSALEKLEKKLADYRQDLLDAMFSPRKRAKQEQPK